MPQAAVSLVRLTTSLDLSRHEIRSLKPCSHLNLVQPMALPKDNLGLPNFNCANMGYRLWVQVHPKEKFQYFQLDWRKG